MANVKVFIIEYFHDRGIESVDEGVHYIHQFFLYVAEKREGTTPAMIRKLASSLKKFYICMYEMGYVSHWVTEEVLYSVDSNLDTWVKKCEERGDR